VTRNGSPMPWCVTNFPFADSREATAFVCAAAELFAPSGKAEETYAFFRAFLADERAFDEPFPGAREVARDLLLFMAGRAASRLNAPKIRRGPAPYEGRYGTSMDTETGPDPETDERLRSIVSSARFREVSAALTPRGSPKRVLSADLDDRTVALSRHLFPPDTPEDLRDVRFGPFYDAPPEEKGAFIVRAFFHGDPEARHNALFRLVSLGGGRLRSPLEAPWLPELLTAMGSVDRLWAEIVVTKRLPAALASLGERAFVAAKNASLPLAERARLFLGAPTAEGLGSRGDPRAGLFWTSVLLEHRLVDAEFPHALKDLAAPDNLEAEPVGSPVWDFPAAAELPAPAVFHPVVRVEAPRRLMEHHALDAEYHPPVCVEEIDTRFLTAVDEHLREALVRAPHMPVSWLYRQRTLREFTKEAIESIRGEMGDRDKWTTTPVSTLASGTRSSTSSVTPCGPCADT